MFTVRIFSDSRFRPLGSRFLRRNIVWYHHQHHHHHHHRPGVLFFPPFFFFLITRAFLWCSKGKKEGCISKRALLRQKQGWRLIAPRQAVIWLDVHVGGEGRRGLVDRRLSASFFRKETFEKIRQEQKGSREQASANIFSERRWVKMPLLCFRVHRPVFYIRSD